MRGGRCERPKPEKRPHDPAAQPMRLRDHQRLKNDRGHENASRPGHGKQDRGVHREFEFVNQIA